jgi:DNA-binding MarR family transcriptional regulator
MSKLDGRRLGEALTELALAVFRANGALIARGDVLVEAVGLTSARWQVLGALALAGGTLTVPEIARSMGLTRQGIQKQVNLLIDDGLVSTRSNPAHERSQLVELTVAGRAAYSRADRRWTVEAARLSNGRSLGALKGAVRELDALTARLRAAAEAEV